MYYTYAFLREDRTPYYVGKGKGNRAYRRGKYDIKPPKDKSRIILLKQNLTEQEAFKHEIYMIAVFGRKDLGTGILHNRTNGGGGSSGTIMSEETRRKMSESQKGKTVSEETRRKLSEAHKGKTVSEEHRRRLQSYNINKVVSEETKRKMSETRKGRPGKPHTEETKRRLSDIRKNRISTPKDSIGGKIGGRVTSSQRWKCLVTGHISNAGSLTLYQRARGIDTSQRERVE